MSNARRTIACLLIGVGALLLAAAVMVPTYTVGKVAKTPLDLQVTTIAKSVPGEESRVLDARSLTSPEGSARIDTDVPIVSQRFLTVEEPSGADQMTLQAGQTLRRDDRDGDTGLLTASVDRVTIDRRTGEPIPVSPNGSIALTVDRSGDSVADPSQRAGLQYRFPIGTEKKSYPYFDLNARATYDIDYIDESEVNGVPVYHFRQTIPVTNMWDVFPAATNKLTLPAAKWGLEGDEQVTMTRFYTNTRDVWVEPRTGAILKGGEQLHLYYGRSAERVDVTALKAHLVFDEDTIDAQMAVTRDSLDRLTLFGRTLPIGVAVVGGTALLTGIILGVRSGISRRRRGVR
ncbi:DUF3068 domain-containing protein [Nocardia cyriacigeorgica]|uniref:DUF3068 domain-containing protein n=1 Tax=Nocardia cyriacigeorgica TaxID=135487 RepID=A0A6P1D4Q7_9NOCA|nr:DUF3068 domain-containing protein [Nocardia cyriacigeorgica]NEW37586.1 DUF3068 domain-containing protein [Nocardia cyriacigeorgica]NEW45028.1 DUF3068 domain-containing protein [Nocardia cyriacigeorgica]NEW49026.1 DUF3068 domain-containing protein [Nocardia cyriacigeorgica]